LERKSWQTIGRELTRIGLVSAAPGKFATLELTNAGLNALRERRPITLTKPPDAVVRKQIKPRAGEIDCDEQLFDRLRTLRRKLADERSVPAYIIFSDASLREMARRFPTSSERLGDVPGVGKQKLKSFGSDFLAEITEYLQTQSAGQSAVLD